MKQETKHLIQWIKAVIEQSLPKAMPYVETDIGKQKKDAISFLDSLPEIESKLCQGGYVQDANGTPCCHGDKIIVGMYGKKIYTLEWNPKQRCFCFVRPFDNGSKSMYTLGENFFTKVEVNVYQG